jgi:hypothetical protein
MRRLRLLLGVGAVCLVLLTWAGAALLLRVPAAPICPEGAARIMPGMTEKEVVGVLSGRTPQHTSGG